MRTSLLALATAAATLFTSASALPAGSLEERNFGLAPFIESPPDSATANGAAFYPSGSILPFKFSKGAANSGGVTTYSTKYIKVIISGHNEDGSNSNYTLANYLTSSNTSSTISADFIVPNFAKLASPHHIDTNGRIIVEETSTGNTVQTYVSRFEI
ncbi:hypothetical protein ACM66B_005180 [Microbotryomycetes sp. NB124-2]